MQFLNVQEGTTLTDHLVGLNAKYPLSSFEREMVDFLESTSRLLGQPALARVRSLSLSLSLLFFPTDNVIYRWRLAQSPRHRRRRLPRSTRENQTTTRWYDTSPRPTLQTSNSEDPIDHGKTSQVDSCRGSEGGSTETGKRVDSLFFVLDVLFPPFLYL